LTSHVPIILTENRSNRAKAFQLVSTLEGIKADIYSDATGRTESNIGLFYQSSDEEGKRNFFLIF
jgi:hypothetical protein